MICWSKFWAAIKGEKINLFFWKHRPEFYWVVYPALSLSLWPRPGQEAAWGSFTVAQFVVTAPLIGEAYSWGRRNRRPPGTSGQIQKSAGTPVLRFLFFGLFFTLRPYEVVRWCHPRSAWVWLLGQSSLKTPHWHAQSPVSGDSYSSQVNTEK